MLIYFQSRELPYHWMYKQGVKYSVNIKTGSRNLSACQNRDLNDNWLFKQGENKVFIEC